MLITIANVLDIDGLRAANDLVGHVAWRNGTKTAGSTAKQVKQNLQADLTSRSGAKLRELLKAAIDQNPVFRAAAQPRHWSKLLVSKTEAGGGYGMHVDNAFMSGPDGEIRTDLSFTLFLSDPGGYDGGHLVIEHAGETQRHKPAAGDLVLYPSTSLHEVAEVTSGTRLVCVGWIESRIPRTDDRELLFTLLNLKASLSSTHSAQSIEMLALAQIISNLQRRFS